MQVLKYPLDTAQEVVVPQRVRASCRRLDLDVLDAALEALILRLDVLQVNNVIVMRRGGNGTQNILGNCLRRWNKKNNTRENSCRHKNEKI